jgi:hypothetical protein
MRLASDDTLEVERDAGMRESLHRVSGNAALPPDLPGRYHNPDTAATWTINASETGMTVHVVGPLRIAGPWEIEPIDDADIRIISPTPLFGAWHDTRVVRDAGGRITGLHVDGGRARNLLFTREAER